jgi:polyvinyl alcohol dehydrogenase (cytochrome)
MRLVFLRRPRRISFAQIPDAGKCAGTPKPFAPGAGDWNGWGVDASGSRFQPAPGIAAGDVPKLRLKWAFAFPGVVNQRNQAQPVIVGGARVR